VKTLAKIIFPFIITGIVIGGVVLYSQLVTVDVLNPQGDIARQQRDLILFTTGLGMFVIIPVFIMLGLFAWKFREGNQKAKYRPDWDGNNKLEAIWWGIPTIIIIVLSIITWQTSHSLDPYRAIDSNVKPVEVQVVALQWKWLFIYPELGIASANLLQIPEKTPINFTITSDAPMNSFWIPSLGSQVYAMSGMSTKLHLIADKPGDYNGSSANISGEGFADMKFIARSSTQTDFNTWVQQVKNSSQVLDQSRYDKLALPDSLDKPHYYVVEDTGLYDRIVMKYMAPMHHEEDKKDGVDSEERNETPAGHDHSNMYDMGDR
jgi:cytochrome o ubiquinol oxidase subunit II